VPVFLSGGKNLKLDKGGILLSCFEDTIYLEEEIQFEKGSTLVLFTDGITEAMNESEEEYGEERFFSTIEKNSALSSQNLGAEILRDVKEFTCGASQSDDITLMVIKRYE
jgi:sigma-B regulation protein RsbU (phosphoserine phosphatase)